MRDGPGGMGHAGWARRTGKMGDEAGGAALVGVEGFEPPTLNPQSSGSTTELHPETGLIVPRSRGRPGVPYRRIWTRLGDAARTMREPPDPKESAT